MNGQRIYQYSGPPSINLGTWDDRHNSANSSQKSHKSSLNRFSANGGQLNTWEDLHPSKPVPVAPKPGSSGGRLSSRYSLGSPSPSPSSSTPSPPLIHEELNHSHNSQSSQQRVSHKYSRDAVDHGIDLKAEDMSHLPDQVNSESDESLIRSL